MELKDKKIYLTEEEKQRSKKITGTRLGAVLGFNTYSTPFQCWAEMLHVFEPPYEDTIYTLAGKAIEPKQAAYVAEKFPELKIVYPKDMFGEDYFSATHGNFFTNTYFGGMWDYLGQIDNNTICVFEMKTAGVSKKRDWSGSKVPESYALQASLYAWLLGVDQVKMVVTYLNQKNGDYEQPENFVVSEENTEFREFKVSERYPAFEENYIKPAIQWWMDHIETGISPEWDDIKDAEVLQTIKSNLNTSTSSDSVVDVSAVNIYTAQLDKMVDDVNKCIASLDLYAARKYYMQLPLLIYNTSMTIQGLNNSDLYNAAKDKLDNAKLVAKMLENVIMNPNQFSIKRTLNE